MPIAFWTLWIRFRTPTYDVPDFMRADRNVSLGVRNINFGVLDCAWRGSELGGVAF